MPISPSLRAQLELMDGVPAPEVLFADPVALAAYTEAMADREPWVAQRVEIDDVCIEGPHGPVRLRRYRPTAELSPSAPTLVWAHGGGFLGGDLAMNEAHMVAVELALRAPARILSVEYRLAVEGVHFPIPRDDVLAGLAWASETYGPSSRIAIGGASAGANLALSAAIRAVVERQWVPAAVLLAYPFVHFPVPTLPFEVADEMRSVPPAARFSASMVELMTAAYVGGLTQIPADAMPGNARLNGLPKTLVLSAEYDDLRPSAELLVKQLRASSVDVDSHLQSGMLHGFLDLSPEVQEVDQVLDVMAATLQELY